MSQNCDESRKGTKFEAPVMKRAAESRDKNGEPIDVYKCPFCQRRMQIAADEVHPYHCPWGCER